MTILSVDLAYKRWRDLGIALLTKPGDTVEVEFIRPRDGELDPAALATYLDELCAAKGVRLLLLDGPQAWKDEENGFEHARVCERQLNTPAKTGVPGAVKPAAYGPFVRFSIAVYDALADLGWTRLDRGDGSWDRRQKTVVESFPLSAWRSLGLKALGAKRKAKPLAVASQLAALKEVVPINVRDTPTHDELQALVAGLAGVGMESGEAEGWTAIGAPPFQRDGVWREGFIVNPLAGSTAPGGGPRSGSQETVTAGEIPRLLNDLARDVFALDLHEHAEAVRRPLFVLTMVQSEERTTVAVDPVTCGVPDELLQAFAAAGLPCGWAATAVNVASLIPYDGSADALFVAERLLSEPRREVIATLFHELCHFVVESGLGEMYGASDVDNIAAGQAIRRYTQYNSDAAFTSENRHTDAFFATLFMMAKRLAHARPEYFKSHQDAVETALIFDRFAEPMNDVPW